MKRLFETIPSTLKPFKEFINSEINTQYKEWGNACIKLLEAMQNEPGTYDQNKISEIIITCASRSAQDSPLSTRDAIRIQQEIDALPLVPSEETKELYRQQLRSFKKFLTQPENNLLEEQGELLITQLNRMSKKIETYSPATQNDIKAVIRQCFKLSLQGKVTPNEMKTLQDSFNSLGVAPEPDSKVLATIGNGFLLALKAAAVITATALAIFFAIPTATGSLFALQALFKHFGIGVKDSKEQTTTNIKGQLEEMKTGSQIELEPVATLRESEPKGEEAQDTQSPKL